MNDTYLQRYKRLILRVFLIALLFGEINCSLPAPFLSSPAEAECLTGSASCLDVDRPLFAVSLTAKYEPVQTIRKGRNEGEHIAKKLRHSTANAKSETLRSPFHFRDVRKLFLYTAIINRSMYFNKADYNSCLYAYIHDKDGKKRA